MVLCFYLLGGFTDIADGMVARKTNTVSEFGSKLDTAADFVFVFVCFIKLLPAADIPAWLWIWTVIIAVIKLINIVAGLICNKSFAAVHTVMNKITGVLLFLLPLTLSFIEKNTAALLCVPLQRLPPLRSFAVS